MQPRARRGVLRLHRVLGPLLHHEPGAGGLRAQLRAARSAGYVALVSSSKL